jgi:hypothetical protein
MKGWYIAAQSHEVGITSDRIKYELEANLYIHLEKKNLIELVIPDGADRVYCDNNYLTELIIPNGVKQVYCYNNKLTKLDLPDSIEYIECWYNKLTELIVPDNCRVDCDPNVMIITQTMYNRSIKLKAILK